MGICHLRGLTKPQHHTDVPPTTQNSAERHSGPPPQQREAEATRPSCLGRLTPTIPPLWSELPLPLPFLLLPPPPPSPPPPPPPPAPLPLLTSPATLTLVAPSVQLAQGNLLHMGLPEGPPRRPTPWGLLHPRLLPGSCPLTSKPPMTSRAWML